MSEKRTFSTGSQRSTQADSTRYDLVSEIGLERLAKTYAEGISKGYEEHNWRLGQPFSVLLNHVLWHLNAYKQGDSSEDHLAHAAFGLFALMEFQATRPELNDLYAYQPKQTYEQKEEPAVCDTQADQESDSGKRYTRGMPSGTVSTDRVTLG